MAELSQYFVNNLELRIFPKGLVVQVQEMNEDPPRQNTLMDLPEWVFQSTLAIWFLDGDESLYNRAIAGEKIKNSLMMKLPEIRTKSISFFQQ